VRERARVGACASRNAEQSSHRLANEHDSELKCKDLGILSPSNSTGKIAWLLFAPGKQLARDQRPFLPHAVSKSRNERRDGAFVVCLGDTDAAHVAAGGVPFRSPVADI